jgi:hypothetical protein
MRKIKNCALKFLFSLFFVLSLNFVFAAKKAEAICAGMGYFAFNGLSF